MGTLNRQSKLPLYQQLYEILRGELAHGQWQPGDMIPTETDLMERYAVSRITVRQVLDMLVKDGLIYRQRGRGSFVAHPPIQQPVARIISFTEDMRRRGFTPGTRVLAAELVPAPAEIAQRLSVEPGAELAHIQRLRQADGEPLAVEDAYLVHRYCPGVLSHNYAEQPLRDTLAHEYGLHIVRASQTIRAVQASAEMAAALSVSRRAPLLFIERVSYSDNNVPVEYLLIYYRGDRYALYGELKG